MLIFDFDNFRPDVAESSFIKVKKVLSEKPVLQFTEFFEQFFLFVDCSSNAAGACIAHLDRNNYYRLVCYNIRFCNSSLLFQSQIVL